jgi:hypothetical protein
MVIRWCRVFRGSWTSHPGSGIRKKAQQVLDGLRMIPIKPQARLSILEREVGYV